MVWRLQMSEPELCNEAETQWKASGFFSRQAGFAQRLQARLRQQSFIAACAAKSNVIPGAEDINAIDDENCPRRVGGIEPAKALFYALGVQFDVL